MGNPSLAGPELAAALTGDDVAAREAARAQLAALATGPVEDDLGPTAAAVIEALPKLAPALRAEALVWLADVQVGGHRAQTVLAPERKRRDALPADRAGARTAVADGAAAITALLTDDDPDVRSSAALALGFCPDLGAEAKTALAQRLAPEAEVGVDAAVILSLVRVGAGFRAPINDPAIAAAIAIATAFDGPPNLDGLVAASTIEQVPHLAFGAGRLGDIAAAIAINHTFEPSDAPRLYEALSGVQRTVLEGIVATRAPIDWRALGLPPTVDGRRRFLFLDAPGPSDQFVTHGDAEVPLWFALATGDDATRADALAALTPAQRLVAFLDRAAYGLEAVLPAWTLDELLAAVADDRAAARDAVDAFVAAPHADPLGAEVDAAVAATRDAAGA